MQKLEPRTVGQKNIGRSGRVIADLVGYKYSSNLECGAIQFLVRFIQSSGHQVESLRNPLARKRLQTICFEELIFHIKRRRIQISAETQRGTVVIKSNLKRLKLGQMNKTTPS